MRMPNLGAVIRSLDIPVQRLGPDDIKVDVEKCGLKGSPTRVKKVFPPKVHSDVQFLGESIEEAATGAVAIFRQMGL